MRDLVVAAAAVCAVSGLVLSVMPTHFDNKAVSWFVGFCVGCLAASMLWTLAVIWTM